LSTLSWTANAAPLTYRDDATKFAISLPLSPTEIACIHVPKGELIPGCLKAEGPLGRFSADEHTIVAGTILEGSWNWRLSVGSRHQKNIGEVDAESIQTLGKGLAAELEKRGDPILPNTRGEPWTIKKIQVRGLEGVRFAIDFNTDKSAPLGHFRVYCLYHRDYVHCASLAGPRGHGDELEAFGERMLETVEAAPSDLRFFGEPRVTRGFYLAASETWPYVVGLGALGAALLVRDRVKRRQR
jgi:hypothetical protein